jgi:hypothetical protein
VCIVSPAEGDAIVLEGHETMVGDGYRPRSQPSTRPSA